MEVIEALHTSILEPHDHLRINHVRALGRSVHATQITRFGRNGGGQVGGNRSTVSAAWGAFSWHLSITQCDAVCQQADIRPVADAPGQP
jgi:hypothetical protein